VFTPAVIVLSVILGIIGGYIVLRLASKAIFRSYFEEKINIFKKLKGEKHG
jgi:NO-binding membrane sensor protein with MHYT domain